MEILKRVCIGLFFFSVLILSPLNNVKGQDYDLREVQWWMSRAEVKESESEELLLLEDEEMLAYATKIINMDTFLVYYFDKNDQVWGSTILFRDEYDNKDNYLTDYNYVKNVLSQKYGAPIIDDLQWSDGKVGKESGVQVMLGNLRYSTYWATETTMVNLILEGEDQQILLSIDYCDLEYYLNGLFEETAESESSGESDGL